MKKLLLLASVCFVFVSCVKIEDLEPEEKDYSCQCTYIAISGGSSDGEPDKTETTNVKALDLGEAKVDCSQREAKYFGQDFQGTCIIE